MLALTPQQAEEKSAALTLLLSIVLPGSAELYLGGAHRRLGVYRLISFLLAWALIVGIIGIFLVPLIWLLSIVDGVRYGWGLRKLQREQTYPTSLGPPGDGGLAR